jgi:hypothetical protein
MHYCQQPVIRNCRVVRVPMLAHLANFVCNPTRKCPESATAHTGGRWKQLQGTELNVVISRLNDKAKSAFFESWCFNK